MADTSAEVAAARAKLAARLGGAKQLGGKGTVRRVKKAVTKASSMDDKRLQATLKRLAVNNIPGIEEVNIFKDDGNVIHFENPKVQASIPANTYVVSGSAVTKPIADMMGPDMLGQRGGMNPDAIKSLLAQMSSGKKGAGAGQADIQAMLAQLSASGGAAGGGDDDDMPALEENMDFEEASKA